MSLFLLLLGLALRATPQEPVTVEVSFRVISFEPRHEVYYQPEAHAPRRVIRLHTSALSSDCRYRGPRELTLYASAAGGDALVRVSLEADARRVLVLLHPGGGGNGPRPAATVVRDETGRLRAGAVQVVNLGGRAYGLELAGQWVDAPLGVGATVRVDGESELRLFALVAAGWRRVTVFPLVLGHDARAWLVLLPPYRETELQPRLRLLFDRDAVDEDR